MSFGSLKGTLTGNSNSIGVSNSIAGSVSVNAGDLVFAVLGEQLGLTATTASDNLGNTYTAQNAGTTGFNGQISGRAYWSIVNTAGTLTSVAVVASGSTHDWAGFAVVIEGPFAANASQPDSNPTNINNDTTSPFTCPATGGLTRLNDVVVCWGAANQSTTWAATSPNLLGGNVNNSTNIKVAVGYQAVTSLSSISPAFTSASNPGDAVLGSMGFKGAATSPNGWLRGSSDVVAAAAVWPLAMLLTQPTFIVPPPAAAVASVKAAPLVVDAGYAKSRDVYYQAFARPIGPPTAAATQPPNGWQSILSVAPKVATVNAPSLSFVVPPFTVPSGWRSQLSTAPPVVPVQQGSSFVPLDTRQINTVTIDKWQQPLSIAAPLVPVQQGSSFVPFNTAQITPSVSTSAPLTVDTGYAKSRPVYYQALVRPIGPTASAPQGWQSIVSVAAPVAKAASPQPVISFNTIQVVVAPPNGWAGQFPKAAPVAVAIHTQATQFAVPAPETVPQGWYQPLSVPPAVAQAIQSSAFVPFNTVQTVVSPPKGWYQPLSTAPVNPGAIATQPVWSPIAFPTFSLAWQQPLSVAPATVKPIYTQAFVPFNTTQVIQAPPPLGWFMPLSVAAAVAQALPQPSFVPFDTAQVTAPATNNELHNHPFFAPMGQMMSGY